MVSPERRLSTTVVPGLFLEPEDEQVFDILVVERGPVAIEDTTKGLQLQNWEFWWNPADDNFYATPENTGTPIVIHNIANVSFFRATFDQNGRVVISYVTDISSYLWWYDTAAGSLVTTDLGSDVLTPSISLDDKRTTQASSSDMILWYVKSDGGSAYEIWNSLQRDRFTIQYLKGPCIGSGIRKLGMTSGLRVQLQMSGTA